MTNGSLQSLFRHFNLPPHRLYQFRLAFEDTQAKGALKVMGDDVAQKLGADIILPVAGPVGLGSAAVCKETGNCKVIGVDADWYETAAEFKEIVLTSVLKKIDVAVFNTAKDTIDGNFTSGAVVYALADGGVDIAPFHDFDGAVSAELKAEVEQLKADIISGAVTVDGALAP